MKKEDSRKISIMSFCLFLGVMSIHTYNVGVYGLNLEDRGRYITLVEQFLNRLANNVCVPCFFGISGFLFFRNYDWSKLGSKYLSRCKSILIPYLVWNTIYYLLFAFITRIPAILSVMSVDAPMEFSFRSYLQYIYEGYYTLWFLRVLMQLILFAPIWYFLLKRRRFPTAEIALLFLVLTAMGKTFLPGKYINIYYTLGAYWALNRRDLRFLCNKATAVIAAGLFLVMAGVIGTAGGKWYHIVIFMISGWIALNLFSFAREVPWWVKCTFFYYCAHDMILETVEKLILLLFGRKPFMAAVDYIMAPCITLLLLIAVAWILRNFCKPVWKILSGGRN